MVEYQPQDGDSVLEGARALAEISVSDLPNIGVHVGQ